MLVERCLDLLDHLTADQRLVPEKGVAERSQKGVVREVLLWYAGHVARWGDQRWVIGYSAEKPKRGGLHPTESSALMLPLSTALNYLREKHLDIWVPGLFRQRVRDLSRTRPTGTRHLLLAVCDHFEPLWHPVDPRAVPHARGLSRVASWRDHYPELARHYRDADGLHPRHTFFFPGDQYHGELVGPLAELTASGLAEVELHLHHDRDNERSLREKLDWSVGRLVEHGLLSRAGAAGRPRYGFIHGDWALANGRADGRCCGVDAELPLLFDTGCYADYTFPAAPNECQPRTVNQIYWPIGDLRRRRAYEWGESARVGRSYDDRILIIQGPLALTLRARRMPVQLENSDLTAAFPPDRQRARAWVSQNVHVEGRPEWVFVKLHTHGAPEAAASALLGSAGHALHRVLAREYNDGRRWRLHYVSAREMYNIAIAAMEGKAGDPGQYRDHVLPPPPAAGR